MLRSDTRGITKAEYILLVLLVALAGIGAWRILRGTLVDTTEDAAEVITGDKAVVTVVPGEVRSTGSFARSHGEPEAAADGADVEAAPPDLGSEHAEAPASGGGGGGLLMGGAGPRGMALLLAMAAMGAVSAGDGGAEPAPARGADATTAPAAPAREAAVTRPTGPVRLDDEHVAELVPEVDRAVVHWLGGTVTDAERDAALDRIARDMTRGGSGSDRERAVARGIAWSRFNSQLGDVVLKRVAGGVAHPGRGGLTTTERDRLATVLPDGVTVDAYVEGLTDRFRPYVDTLTAAGVSIGPRGEWSFGDAELTPGAMEDPTLRTAVGLFLGTPSARALGDPERDVAVNVGGWMFPPPGAVPRSEATWRREVETSLGYFKRDMTAYVNAANRASRWTEIAWGIFWRGPGEKSPVELEMDGAYRAMWSDYRLLKMLGVPPEARTQILNAIHEANKVSIEAMGRLNKTLDRITLFCVAAPLIPVAMYAGAAGLGAMGMEATAAANTTAVAAGIPLWVGHGLSGGFATIDALVLGESWGDAYINHLADVGTSAGVVAPFTALLPVATTGVGALAGTLTESALWGERAHRAANILVAVKFAKDMGVEGSKELTNAVQLLEEAYLASRLAKTPEDERLVRELTAAGLKNGLAGGVNLTFALGMTRSSLGEAGAIRSSFRPVETTTGTSPATPELARVRAGEPGAHRETSNNCVDVTVKTIANRLLGREVTVDPVEGVDPHGGQRIADSPVLTDVTAWHSAARFVRSWVSRLGGSWRQVGGIHESLGEIRATVKAAGLREGEIVILQHADHITAGVFHGGKVQWYHAMPGGDFYVLVRTGLIAGSRTSLNIALPPAFVPPPAPVLPPRVDATPPTSALPPAPRSAVLRFNPDNAYGELHHIAGAMSVDPTLRAYVGRPGTARGRVLAEEARSYLTERFGADRVVSRDVFTRTPESLRPSHPERVATGTIVEGLSRDPAGTLAVLREAMGTGPIPEAVKAHVDAALGDTSGRLVVVWNREAGATGAGADRTMSPEMLSDIVARVEAEGMTPVLVGPAPEGGTGSLPGTVVDLTNHWAALPDVRMQVQMFEYLRHRGAVGQVGMMSGGMDAAALTGMPTISIATEVPTVRMGHLDGKLPTFREATPDEVGPLLHHLGTAPPTPPPPLPAPRAEPAPAPPGNDGGLGAVRTPLLEIRGGGPHSELPLTEAQVLELVRQPGAPRLGGNVDGAYLVELPNGRSLVYTTRSFHDASSRASAMATLDTVRTLSDHGVFARVLGAAVRTTGRESGQVVIVMENLGVSRSGRPVSAFGDLRNLRDLADLPLSTRVRVRDDLLHGLLLHPDPHGMNIMWRRVAVRGGGERVDVRLVDPFARVPSLTQRAGLFELTPRGNPYVDQYSPWVHAREVDRALGLPGSPHPDVMLHLGRGYGLAAEAAARSRGAEVEASLPEVTTDPTLLYVPDGRVRTPVPWVDPGGTDARRDPGRPVRIDDRTWIVVPPADPADRLPILMPAPAPRPAPRIPGDPR